MNILIVDDEKTFAEILSENFLRSGENACAVFNAADALDFLKKNEVDVVILDINMKGMDGVNALEEIKKINPEIEVIMLTGYGTVQTARDTLKLGAFDYLSKPCDLDELMNTINHAFERKQLKEENRSLHAVVEKLENPQGEDGIIGTSREIVEILQLIDNIAPTDCTVLIQGESGTGKELVARRVHEKSNRKEKGFIALNCGAIPENLMESELFGYEKGAFTGANSKKIGIFEAFIGGTVFLDEIGDLPLHMQVKLLRVIESQEFQRLGGTKTHKTDIRILSATNKNLEKEVEQDSFRKDLFYRLNVITINLPSLTERPGDIPVLASYFINKFNKQFRKNMAGFTDEAMDILMNYSWPGNVRELENVIERCVILCNDIEISPEYLPGNLIKVKKNYNELPQVTSETSIERIEKDHIKKLLEKYYGHRAKTAAALGISERTLYRKLKRFDLV